MHVACGGLSASRATSPVSDVADENRVRSNVYALLGNLLAAPPDETILDMLGGIDPAPVDETLLTAAWSMLRDAATRGEPQHLAAEFQDLFIGLGRGEVVPYGSWYLTGFLMEQPLAKLRADMRRLGFERQDGICEPEDHAAALCEIMALLAADDEPQPLQTQAAFFQAHIGPWMTRFFRDMQEAPSAHFYRAVGQLGEQFIETDQRHLEMVIDQPDRTPAEPT